MDDISIFKTKPNVLYSITKLHSDGRQERKGVGFSTHIVVGWGVVCANWFTTEVQSITRTGKGCIFETVNSTYLLEEYE